ncbi:MAG: hypothetical protein ACKOUS_12470 [Alphaproteobacteria bacterium]
MSGFVANARMYAVAPAAEEAWRALLAHACAEAGLDLAYVPSPAPRPLEELWRRPDLGAVFMCGYPIALRLAEVRPPPEFLERARRGVGDIGEVEPGLGAGMREERAPGLLGGRRDRVHARVGDEAAHRTPSSSRLRAT